jgi:DNA mismatch endonuclease (patch repair protein)
VESTRVGSPAAAVLHRSCPQSVPQMRQLVGHGRTEMSERPHASSYSALRTMQSNRSVSALEVRFRKALWESGVRGYRLHASLPGRPDVVFPRSRVAVFVNGCFWHRCPKGHLPSPKANKEFWRRKLDDNVRRDRAAIAALTDAGWSVLTFWECDLRVDMNPAVSQVRRGIETGSVDG